MKRPPNIFCVRFTIWLLLALAQRARARTNGHSQRINNKAQSIWRNSISFRNYIKQLTKFVLSSSIVLGLIVGLSLLIAGGTTMEIDLTLDFGPFDGVWWIIGLPILAILVFAILSPLSFLIHRKIAGTGND